MAVLTGASGALRLNGTIVARVRNWSLNINKDALETTCLNTNDREYTSGLRGASGSATVLYDPSDVPTVNLLNRIFQDQLEPTDTVEFSMSEVLGKRISALVLITNVSPSVSTGDVQSADVQFTISGAMTGGF